MRVLSILGLMLTCGLVAEGLGAAVSEAPYQFALARMYAAEGAHERAARAFNKAIELEPEDSYIRLEHAEFLSRRGHLRQALEEVEIALQLDPDNLEALRLSGYLHLEQSSRDSRSVRRAREAFEKLREQQPDDVPAMLTLARIYLRVGERARAIDVLLEAREYGPSHPAIKSALIEALSWSDQGDRADEILDELLSADPDFIEARIALAQRHVDRAHHTQAIELLEVVLDEPLASPEAASLLALELYRRGTSTAVALSQRRSDLQRAAALLDALVEAQPDNTQNLYLRALVSSGMADNRDAIQRLQELRRTASADLLLRVTGKLAELLEHEGRAAEGSAILTELAEQFDAGGEDPIAIGRIWLEVARLEARERQWRELAQAAERLMDVDDEALRIEGTLLSAEAALQQEHHDDALEAIRNHVGAGRTDSRLVLKEADILFAADREREARVLLATFTANADLDQHLAAIQYYLQRDDHEALLPLVEEAIQAADNKDRRHLERDLALIHAQSLAELGRAEEGLDILSDSSGLFEQAGELAADRHRLAEAKLLESAGREAEADRILRLLSDSTRTQTVMLMAQYFQSEKRYGRMIPMLERALGALEHGARDSSIAVDMNFALGMALEREDRVREAEVAFRRVLELDPDDSRTLNYLGYTWADRGENLEEALAMVERAVALEPRNGAYLDSLGWCYFRLEKYEDALGPLKLAARLVPEDATILEHMGDLYLALDDKEKAREHYRRALAVADENVEVVRRKLARLVGDS